MSRPSRSYVWTINNPTEEEVDALFLSLSDATSICDRFRYLVVGVEIGEQGTMHLQGYVELTQPMRIQAVKAALAPARPTVPHLETRRGTREQARSYVADDDKESSLGWVEAGEWIRGGQGHRTDLDECKRKLMDSVPMVEIAEEHFQTWCNNYRAFDKFRFLQQQRSSPRWRNVTVTILWGVSGAGKTRAAYAASDSLFVIHQPESGSLWWDGYENETTLLIDEFTGWISMTRLLGICDGYPLRLSTKGGHSWAFWTHVIITSNRPPTQWYKPEVFQDHPGALKRRTTQVRYFHADGREEDVAFEYIGPSQYISRP